MASLTQWRWVWVSSGGWWWTGRPDPWGHKESDTTERLNSLNNWLICSWKARPTTSGILLCPGNELSLRVDWTSWDSLTLAPQEVGSLPVRTPFPSTRFFNRQVSPSYLSLPEVLQRCVPLSSRSHLPLLAFLAQINLYSLYVYIPICTGSGLHLCYSLFYLIIA